MATPPPYRQPIIRIVTTAVAILIVVFICIYYYSHDPRQPGNAPECMFRLLTGYDCPGCGSQRALFALLHGNVAQAFAFNPFVFFAVPIALLYIYADLCRRKHIRLHALINHPLVLTAIALAVLIWWIGRNVF